MKLVTRLLGLALALVCLAVNPPSLNAENLGPGGGTRIVVGDELVGAYRLLVTVAPEPAQVGRVTFVIRVSDSATEARVRDAAIVVTLVHSATGQVLERRATHEDAGSPVDYAAHVDVLAAGVWNVTIGVEGAAGNAEVAFAQRVLAERRWTTVAVMGIPFLVLIGVLGGVWYARSGGKRKSGDPESMGS